MEKWCYQRGQLGDEFHMPDVKDSCILNSLEYRMQITPWYWLTVRFPTPQSLPQVQQQIIWGFKELASEKLWYIQDLKYFRLYTLVDTTLLKNHLWVYTFPALKSVENGISRIPIFCIVMHFQVKEERQAGHDSGINSIRTLKSGVCHNKHGEVLCCCLLAD